MSVWTHHSAAKEIILPHWSLSVQSETRGMKTTSLKVLSREKRKISSADPLIRGWVARKLNLQWKVISPFHWLIWSRHPNLHTRFELSYVRLFSILMNFYCIKWIGGLQIRKNCWSDWFQTRSVRWHPNSENCNSSSSVVVAVIHVQFMFLNLTWRIFLVLRHSREYFTLVETSPVLISEGLQKNSTYAGRSWPFNSEDLYLATLPVISGPITINWEYS